LTNERDIALERLLAVTEANYERRAQLQHALESRVRIEQAKGVLAERHGLEVEEAFEVIRKAARRNRMKLHDLVAEIGPGLETPPQVLELLDV
jgi:AmiR/NasT family two-component response regulator